MQRSATMSSAKKKKWSWSTGERGVNRVRVYEDPARGVIFAEFYERVAGEHRPKRQRISLAHADGDRATRRAEDVVGHDLRFLNAVFNWATVAGDGKGGVLLERSPFKGFALPREESPRRPIVTEQQYQSLLGVASQVDPLFELALVIAHETGHRGG